MAKKTYKVDVKMVDAINEQNAAIADELLALIERGGLNWAKDWAAPRFTGENCNAEYGKPYQGRNALITAYMAWVNGYEDVRWLTEHQIKKLGYVLHEDAEPVYIEKWKQVLVPVKAVVKDADGNEVEKWTTQKRMRLVGGWRIYNAEDIIGIPEDDGAKSNGIATAHLDADVLKIADRFIETSRCPIYELPQDRAFYSPASDNIKLPLRGQFKTAQGFLRTLLHEMGHSTGKPLYRKGGKSFGDDEYATEELVAELTSAFTAAAVYVDLKDADYMKGYDEQHAAYLKSWVRSKDKDERRKKIFKAAVDASKASAYLMEAYRGEEQTDGKAA